MQQNKFWLTISKKITPLITILSGIVVIVLSQLNWIPDNIVNSTILGLLVLLATSELVEKKSSIETISGKLDNLDKAMKEATREIKAITFSNDKDYFDYLTKRTKESKEYIDQASIDRSRSFGYIKGRTIYLKTRNNVIQLGKVKYRFVGVLSEISRLDLAKDFLVEKRCENFYPVYYSKPEREFPQLDFIIIDREEVIGRYPFDIGQDAGYVSIKSKYVANLFLGYFECLFREGKVIRSEQDINSFKEQFEKGN